MTSSVPSLGLLVDAADSMLAVSIRESVAVEHRRAALGEELSWRLDVAAQSVEYAATYHARVPVPGACDEDYLDRWLNVSEDLSVLAGPRFRALDPDMPFVGIVGASRPITATDLPALRRLATDHFRLFSPRYLCLWAGHPAGAWAGTGADMRLLAGRLYDLRQRNVPAALEAHALTDVSFYEDYCALYARHHKLRPAHRTQARPQPVEDLEQLIAAGTAWSVHLDGQPAGIIAARPGVAGGCRGAEVVELALDPHFCGHGYGQHLSTLLAQHVPEPADQFLIGTIHIDNQPAYRAALTAGRIDIGGEITTPV